MRRRLRRLIPAAATVLLAAGCAAGVDGHASAATTTSSATQATTTSAAPTTAAAAVPVGGTVFTGNDDTSFFGGRGVFATLTPKLGPDRLLAVYDARTGALISSAPRRLPTDPSCGVAVVRQASGRVLVLGEDAVVTPPQGLQAGTVAQRLTAFDATDLSQVWQTVVYSAPNDGSVIASNSCDGARPTLESSLRFTTSGDVALSTYDRFADPYLVDLRSGTAKPSPTSITTLGRWVVNGRGGAPGTRPTAVDLVDPATGTVAGSSSDEPVVNTLLARLSGGDSSVALAPDETVGYVAGGSDPGGYSFPAMRRLWSVPGTGSARYQVFWSPGGAAGIIDKSYYVSSGVTGYTALDLATGAPKWTLSPESVTCAVGRHAVALVANSQLVMVASDTGKQIAFDATVHSCPSPLGDALLAGTRVVSLGAE